MSVLPRFPRGAVLERPSSSEFGWATELTYRVSDMTLSEQNDRTERAHSNHHPSFHTPSIPGTPRSNTAPLNSLVSVNHQQNGRSNRQQKWPETTANKIEVLVTIEVITETESKTYQQLKAHSGIPILNRTRCLSSKRRPLVQFRYILSPSPTPTRPCPIKHVLRRSIQDEYCSICSASLTSGPMENLVWCKGSCGSNFHKFCLDEWRMYAPNPLRCIYWYVYFHITYHAQPSIHCPPTDKLLKRVGRHQLKIKIDQFLVIRKTQID